MFDRNRKAFLIFFAVLGVAAIITIASVSLSSCSRERRFDRLVEDARYLYEARDFKKCVSTVDEALEIESHPELYLLLADAYMALDDIDSAIEWLYVGSYKHVSSIIETKLGELKTLKSSEDDGSFIELGGQKFDIYAKSLSLSPGQVSDISILDDLTSLETLTLSDNAIADLSPLGALTKLTYLNLSGNRAADISPLGKLRNLRTLYIDGNPVEDFTPLYSLRELRSLSIKNVDLTEKQLNDLKIALPACHINHDEPKASAVELTLGGTAFMSDVKELSLIGLGIVDLTVLEQCDSLTRLDLSHNAISNLTPLSGLHRLEWLNLTGNMIVDISSLSGLPALKYLSLDANRVHDLSPLVASFSIEELWLSYNNFTDASSLSGLHSLVRLGLRGLGLTDAHLEALKPITSLRELALDENPVLTMGALDDLKHALYNCVITHSDAFYTITLGDSEFRSDAVEISAPNAGISDISGLSDFKNLQSLILPGNNITSAQPLSGLLKLEMIDFGNNIGGTNSVTDLAPLSSLSALKSLSLIRNGVSDLTALSELVNLTELHLSFNSISNISALGRLTNLRTLSLSYNQISDIWGLGALVDLAELDLEGNHISDLTPLYGLAGLRVLYIGSNEISEEALETLRSHLPNCAIYADTY